jgi:hypothetical protein
VKVIILVQEMESRNSNAKIGFIGLVRQGKVNGIKKTRLTLRRKRPRVWVKVIVIEKASYRPG